MIDLYAEIRGITKGKRVKTGNDKEEGLQVLFDFLISLLTRQSSTLRFVTNKTY